MPKSLSSGEVVRRQGVFWLLTIPASAFSRPECLQPELAWIIGQRETGEGGYDHWQVCVAFREKVALAGVKKVFGRACHAELSRSEAAATYCQKEDSSVAGTRFEFGAKPIRRNSKVDWDSVWEFAKSGDLEKVPGHVRVVNYRTLRCIGSDHLIPVGLVKVVRVYWGATGTGKSRRAWGEAGLHAYCKDPRSKFWDGYQGQSDVIIDEFRGGIDISHLLRWFDRYPVRVEVKGSSKCLAAERIWITSNIPPEQWYPECDEETLAALRRRIEVTRFLPKI